MVDFGIQVRSVRTISSITISSLPSFLRGGFMSSSNIVIDLSHHNGRVDLTLAKDAGILGIIHKATQGWQYSHQCTRRIKALPLPQAFSGVLTTLVWVPTV